MFDYTFPDYTFPEISVYLDVYIVSYTEITLKFIIPK